MKKIVLFIMLFQCLNVYAFVTRGVKIDPRMSRDDNIPKHSYYYTGNKDTRIVDVSPKFEKRIREIKDIYNRRDLFKSDLENITEFTSVTDIPMRDLVLLPNGVKIKLGTKGSEFYAEGMIINNAFIHGIFVGDEEIFHPGLLSHEGFTPGLFIDGKFVPGKVFENNFVPGIVVGYDFHIGTIRNHEFEKGYINIDITMDNNINIIFKRGNIQDADTDFDKIFQGGSLAVGGISTVAGSISDDLGFFGAAVGGTIGFAVGGGGGAAAGAAIGHQIGEYVGKKVEEWVEEESKTGDDNSGDDNSGDDNPGDDNSGDDDSGDDDSGDDDSGDDDSGDDDSGDDDSGDDDSGDDNSGDDDSGDDDPNDNEWNPVGDDEEPGDYGSSPDDWMAAASDFGGSGLGTVINPGDWGFDEEELGNYGAPTGDKDQIIKVELGKVINTGGFEDDSDFGGAEMGITLEDITGPVINIPLSNFFITGTWNYPYL